MFFPLLIWFWLWKVFWLTQLALSDILCALVERTVAVITFFWLPAPQFPLNRQGNLTFSIAGKRDSEGVGMRFPAGGSSGYDAWLCLIKDLACSQWCAPFPVWRYVWKRMNWLCPWALPAKRRFPPFFFDATGYLLNPFFPSLWIIVSRYACEILTTHIPFSVPPQRWGITVTLWCFFLSSLSLVSFC